MVAWQKLSYVVMWLFISACMAESGTKTGGGKYPNNHALNPDLNNALDATANPEADNRAGEANEVKEAIEDEIKKYTGTPSGGDASPSPGSQLQSITKTLEAGSKKIDMVWVMDNYYKYKANLAKTQKSIQSLVTRFSSGTEAIDLKVATVSCVGEGDGYSECIEKSEISQWSGVTIIRRPWKKDDANKLPLIVKDLLTDSSSELNSFLNQRTDAKKVFIFVTNTFANPFLDKGGEDKHGTQHEGLMPFLDQKFNKKNVSVLSFSTVRPTIDQLDLTSSSNPSEDKKKLQRAFSSLNPYLAGTTDQYARIGTKLKSGCARYYSQVYEVMSAYYGGETYDVCQSDWSASTQKMAAHIKAISHPTVALEELKDKLNIQISSVTVDGEKLSTSDYHVIGSRPPSIAVLKSFEGSPDVVTQTTYD